MTRELQESVQLLNTAIVKTKEAQIDTSYEERLSKVCSSPAVEALGHAVDFLADKKKISRDQAAIQIIETVRDLDKVWNDYVVMEGLSKLKQALKADRKH